MRTLIAALALALALVCLLPLGAHAAIVDIHVTSAANSGPNTLRQAIIDGNALVATNDLPRILIDLDNASPILLTAPLPTVTATYLQIRGTGSHRARIDGGGAHRILTTNSSVLLLHLKNVVLINGYSTQGAGCLQMSNPTSSGFATLENVWFRNCRQSGVASGSNGGAVNTSHNLTIKDSLFSFNGVVSNGSNQGGAISLFGDDSDLTIRGSRFESNSSVSNGPAGSAAAYGGAIFVLRGKSVTIEDSVFADNHTDTPNDNGPGIRLGGALYVRLSGKLSLVRTALFGNDAGTGGAIHHTGSNIGNTSVELRNVSAFDNRATQGNGGVLASAGALTLYNNTFWRNRATGAGDNLASVGSTASIVAAHNNLFAAGVGVGDSCSGFTTVSSGYNIVPAIECGLGASSSDIITSDLHIRGFYTGPGWDFTVQLYSSSPAFDAGNPLAPSNTIAGRCATTDFFGQPRPVDASGTGTAPRCDIGALEAQSEPSLFIDDFDGRWLRP